MSHFMQDFLTLHPLLVISGIVCPTSDWLTGSICPPNICALAYWDFSSVLSPAVETLLQLSSPNIMEQKNFVNCLLWCFELLLLCARRDAVLASFRSGLLINVMMLPQCCSAYACTVGKFWTQMLSKEFRLLLSTSNTRSTLHPVCSSWDFIAYMQFQLHLRCVHTVWVQSGI